MNKCNFHEINILQKKYTSAALEHKLSINEWLKQIQKCLMIYDEE